MTTTLTWKDLPQIGDGHDSNYDRAVPIGFDSEGDIEYGLEAVPCGEWFDGHKRYCDPHEQLFEAEYPQGWAYYPGDVCRHGRYVGGSGADLMCINCELGDE